MTAEHQLQQGRRRYWRSLLVEKYWFKPMWFNNMFTNKIQKNWNSYRHLNSGDVLSVLMFGPSRRGMSWDWYRSGKFRVGLSVWSRRVCFVVIYKKLFFYWYVEWCCGKFEDKDTLFILEALKKVTNLPLCVGIPHFREIVEQYLRDL